jgi:hypothetical protein
VVNTVRFGYTDNLYRNTNNVSSSFVTDTVDFSFRAALSDRTDVLVKSRINLLTDSGDNQLYPNLYAMLSHNISPRLLLRLSENYRSGEQSGTGSTPQNNVRYSYFQNEAKASLDYVLTGKDRLEGSLTHTIRRHDKDIEENDYTTVEAGVSWKRELVPQRTSASLNLRQRRVVYDNRPVNTPTVFYLEDNAFYDATELSAGLSHTFNQEWQGSFEAGVTRVQPNFSDSAVWINPPGGWFLNEAANETTMNPLLRVGLVYSPSSRTRLTGDLARSYTESDNNGYGGRTVTELRFGFQHDITAKLMAKATARFANTSYDAQDSMTGKATDETEDRMDFEFRLTYKLNRINFLEAGVRHTTVDRSVKNGSWDENRMDIGWRVELN